MGIADNWGARSKKILVEINEARAQRAGIANQDVALSLQTLFSGFDTTEYREDDKIIPVVLRSVGAGSIDEAQFGAVNVFSPSSRHRNGVATLEDLPAQSAEDGHSGIGPRAGCTGKHSEPTDRAMARG